MSMVFIVIDHKQKILQMKYREGQVEYNGKKGMTMLRTMVIQWIMNNQEAGAFEYCFVNYIFKGYSGQDNVQVASAIQEIRQWIGQTYDNVRDIVIQSDNASCFSSQELIPFIYHLNKETHDSPKISRWIFTEPCMGKSRLDTHFSYINLVLKNFVEDGLNVDIEDDIARAVSFKGGVAGTTTVLLDCSQFGKTCISKKFTFGPLGSRATHDIEWKDVVDRNVQGGVVLTSVSGMSESKKVKKVELDKHT